MKRREFITVLGGAAAGYPIVAGEQQSGVRVIGWLSGRNAETDALLLPAFRHGLSMHGYVEGRNVLLEYRYAGGQSDRLPSLVAELVNQQAAAIIAVGTGDAESVRMLKEPATTIPIIFNIGFDPVA